VGAAAPSLVISVVDSNGRALKWRRRVERNVVAQLSQMASRGPVARRGGCFSGSRGMEGERASGVQPSGDMWGNEERGAVGHGAWGSRRGGGQCLA
jgi:hypothetical protein